MNRKTWSLFFGSGAKLDQTNLRVNKAGRYVFHLNNVEKDVFIQIIKNSTP